ncbi:MAG: alkaline phosphatase family protein [Thermoanaerobaculia bacterium]
MLLALLAGLRRERVARLLPWALTVVLAWSAALAWYHASHYSYFLPPGINVRLIKAAVFISLASLVAFYTALLHTLNQRPYGLRSRVGLLLVSIAAVYLMLERRDAFEPRPESAPLPTALEDVEVPHLLTIGVDGATFEALLPLSEQGLLPFLSRPLLSGARARLRPLTPDLPSATWSTVATGKLPYRHQVLDREFYLAPALGPNAYLALLPESMGFRTWGAPGPRRRPTDATHRRALTLWEILGVLGYRAGVLGWPAAVPAHAPVEFAFSERYFRGEPTEAQATPAELIERGLLFRQQTTEIPDELLESIGVVGAPPDALREALADDLWRTGLTSFLLEQSPDVHSLFLRLPGLATVSDRDYGGFDAVQFAGRTDREARAAAASVAGYYRFVDAQVSRLWDAWPAPKTLAIVSTHGYEGPPAWRRYLDPILGSALGGRSDPDADGVFVLWAQGTSPGTLDRAELVDVMPTLLYALGLPLPRDLDGRVLTGSFTNVFLATHPLTFVPSYETVVVPESFAIDPLERAVSGSSSGETIEQRP